MTIKDIDQVDVFGCRVLVRVDLNVPFEGSEVKDASRIVSVLPTLKNLAERGARIVLLSHFGRPKGRDNALSLRPIAPVIASLSGIPVHFADDCIGEAAEQAVLRLKNGEILLLENTRFHAGEELNSPDFVAALARLGDIYVNDAFSAAHRAHASTVGLAHVLPAYVGLAMRGELEALKIALLHPTRPLMAVVGGAKVSSKIELLENLVSKVDILVIGGGMANTFLFALGHQVGTSLAEKGLVDVALKILNVAKESGCYIVLPVDAVVAQAFEAHAPHQVFDVGSIPEHGMMLDAGPASVLQIKAALDRAATLVWNGPLGAFEMMPFDAATVEAARYAAQLTLAGRLVSVAGGGDTVAALNHAGVSQRFSYVSMAGGAFLEWLEGKVLPGVACLES